MKCKLKETEIMSVVRPSPSQAYVSDAANENVIDILVAHNCKLSDATRPMYHIDMSGLTGEFNQCVVGFSDTKSTFTKLYKDKQIGRASCRERV